MIFFSSRAFTRGRTRSNSSGGGGSGAESLRPNWIDGKIILKYTIENKSFRVLIKVLVVIVFILDEKEGCIYTKGVIQLAILIVE